MTGPVSGRGRGGGGTPLVVPPASPARRPLALVAAVAAGTLVSVGLGVYGRLHEPTFYGINIAGFSSGLAAKSWLASLAFVLVILQVVSARMMYRPAGAPAWAAPAHRWSGRVAVLVTVPIAVHCLYALGFADGSLRVFVHSVAGCFLYGVFATKMLVLQQRGAPKWSLPVLGGLLFTALTTLWLTSSLWFFTTTGLTF